MQIAVIGSGAEWAPQAEEVGRLLAGRGCVVFVGYNDGYGKLVVIQHRLGMTSWYAHLARITVRKGRCVVAGNRVGLAGSTGHSSGGGSPAPVNSRCNTRLGRPARPIVERCSRSGRISMTSPASAQQT